MSDTDLRGIWCSGSTRRGDTIDGETFVSSSIPNVPALRGKKEAGEQNNNPAGVYGRKVRLGYRSSVPEWGFFGYYQSQILIIRTYLAKWTRLSQSQRTLTPHQKPTHRKRFPAQADTLLPLPPPLHSPLLLKRKKGRNSDSICGERSRQTGRHLQGDEGCDLPPPENEESQIAPPPPERQYCPGTRREYALLKFLPMNGVVRRELPPSTKVSEAAVAMEALIPTKTMPGLL
jgi:hypothetical protein